MSQEFMETISTQIYTYSHLHILPTFKLCLFSKEPFNNCRSFHFTTGSGHSGQKKISSYCYISILLFKFFFFILKTFLLYSYIIWLIQLYTNIIRYF